MPTAARHTAHLDRLRCRTLLLFVLSVTGGASGGKGSNRLPLSAAAYTDASQSLTHRVPLECSPGVAAEPLAGCSGFTKFGTFELSKRLKVEGYGPHLPRHRWTDGQRPTTPFPSQTTISLLRCLQPCTGCWGWRPPRPLPLGSLPPPFSPLGGGPRTLRFC